jgi:ABC-type branched-subunit amino acid transport system ATPase component
MNKLRLVTVTGSRTTTLYHMLKHYAHLVDEMCVVVYEWEGSSTYDEVSKNPLVLEAYMGTVEVS